MVIREREPDPSWPQTFRDVPATVTQDTSGYQLTQAGGGGLLPTDSSQEGLQHVLRDPELHVF